MTAKICSNTILNSEGWLEFNRRKWGYRSERLRLTVEGKEIPSIEVVLYLDRKGHIKQPRLNPYLSAKFVPTPTSSVARLTSQWITVSSLFVEELARRGLNGAIALPPEFPDVRPWQWAHFVIGIRYTHVIELPHDMRQLTRGPRNRITRASKVGFSGDLTTNMADVAACLQSTEHRQDFSYRLSVEDLELARTLFGDESFRCYVCYAPNGEPASASVVLHLRDQTALAWVAGTKQTYLAEGAAQLVKRFMLDDLAKAGAVAIDFMGANLPGVSREKIGWGGFLVPFYTVMQPGLKSVTKHVQTIWHYHAARLRKHSPEHDPEETGRGEPNGTPKRAHA